MSLLNKKKWIPLDLILQRLQLKIGQGLSAKQPVVVWIINLNKTKYRHIYQQKPGYTWKMIPKLKVSKWIPNRTMKEADIERKKKKKSAFLPFLLQPAICFASFCGRDRKSLNASLAPQQGTVGEFSGTGTRQAKCGLKNKSRIP